MRFTSTLLFTVCAVFSFCSLPAKAQSYTVTDLGVIGGHISVATAINDAGQVVGYSYTSNKNAVDHAFLWTASTGMQDLGTFGGYNSYALAINNAGQVVGCSDTSANINGHAFLWTQAGGLQDLGTLGGSSSCAAGINDAGQVVGEATDNTNSQRAFLWTATGGMQDLGVAVGGMATAINNSSVVAGTFPTSSGSTHAFQWTVAGGVQDLGTLGTGFAQATSINSFAEIVGRSGVPSSKSDGLDLGFRWTSSGGMKALPPLFRNIDADALAVNASGEIVGFALNPKTQQRAVMWDTSLKVHDLNQLAVNSPLILLMANGVNSSGQIVGVGQNKINPGLSHAYLLSPAKK